MLTTFGQQIDIQSDSEAVKKTAGLIIKDSSVKSDNKDRAFEDVTDDSSDSSASEAVTAAETPDSSSSSADSGHDSGQDDSDKHDSSEETDFQRELKSRLQSVEPLIAEYVRYGHGQ